MNKKIGIGILLVIVVIAVGLLVRKNTHTSLSGETVTIGAALPFTGDAGIWGEAARNGINLAVDEINKDGGVGGKRLAVVFEDTRSTSKDSVSAASKLQNIDGARALLVGWLDVYQGAESVLKPGVLLISPDAGIEAVNGVKPHSNVFSTWYRTQPKSELAIQHMAEHGRKTLYIVAQNDSYYTGAVAFMEDAAKKYGVEIVGKDMLNPGTDIQSVLVKIKEKKPDAVFQALYDEKQNVGFVKKHTAFLGSDIAIYSDEFTQQNYQRTDLNTAWFEGFYFYAPQTPNTTFFNTYKALYKVDPVFGASTAYDAVYMIRKALAENPRDYDSYMRNTTFDTVSYGPVTFDALGGVSTPEKYFVMKQVKNGAAVDAQ